MVCHWTRPDYAVILNWFIGIPQYIILKKNILTVNMQTKYRLLRGIFSVLFTVGCVLFQVLSNLVEFGHRKKVVSELLYTFCHERISQSVKEL